MKATRKTILVSILSLIITGVMMYGYLNYHIATKNFFILAFQEEIIKTVPAIILAWVFKENRNFMIILWAVGFALIENAMYVRYSPDMMQTLTARSLVSLPAHFCFSLITIKSRNIPSGILIAWVGHGLFNYWLESCPILWFVPWYIIWVLISQNDRI